MKLRKLSTVMLAGMLIVLIQMPSAYAGSTFKDFLKKTFGEKKRSDEKIVQGLKEALQIGTENAVSLVSKVDGYYSNPKIRIPLPKAVEKAEMVLKAVGYGPEVDAFSRSMNRAAERAAPEATTLFWDAIMQMTFEDVTKILNGRDDEATLYFKEKTYHRLHEIFKPIIHTAMSEVGVTHAYQELQVTMNTIPFADRLDLDLDAYVTEKALDGLFYMLAEEERKIRRDPAARVTELLKEVFGDEGR